MIWIATNPSRSPSRRRFHAAGKASTAAPKRSAVSTPLHPFSIATAKRLERISVPWTVTCSPRTFRIAAETRAMTLVKGTMTASLTGWEATIA